MTAVAVRFENVCKDYSVSWIRGQVVHAVRGATLEIKPGEVFGLLGPNRAGKTTLIKILLSLCRATSGEVTRLGQPISDRATLARVGYMHENHAFPRYLTAAELLRFYGALSLVPEEQLNERVEKLLKRVGLADRSREPISQFSKGMVQRLGLAQAIINQPDLLVLDEPTEGLDLEGRKTLRNIVNDLKSKGKTVLLVSHVTQEVEQLCDRIGVIVNGRVVKVSPLRDLLQESDNGESPSLESVLHDLYQK